MAERANLFLKKLEQCKTIFDFTDPNVDIDAKNIKTQTLTEIMEYISTTKDSLTEYMYGEIASMVRLISRCVPV